MNSNHLTSQFDGSEIAIIGMSGRFPGARNVEEFWHNLCGGVESISFFSDEELLAAGVDAEMLRDPNYVKAGGALEDIDLFDAAFFGFSPREAEIMDPQHRLFLECAWEALENASYNPHSYDGLIGVYAGAATSTYMLYNVWANPEIVKSVGGMQVSISNGTDFLATRVSYKLNLKGPSIVIKSACSTSLVAIHVACQNLLSGECDIALAGGVAIGSRQKNGYLYREGGIKAPDGHCRAFDEKAMGTVGGFGLGIVVLKNLADALADGDHIHAVIRGSAINNDGSFKVGYTAPSIKGQARVITEAMSAAQVEPETITYVETHGTGTVLGDPIEVAALKHAFGADIERKQFCALGSVKTNVGHLDAAAGVVGVIKTALSLKHGLLPPSLNFETPNPKIDFANSPFYVNTTLAKWVVEQTPRRAGVSSFGIGGTNAHAILEEPPLSEDSSASRASQLIILSAQTESALDVLTANLARYLRQNPELNLADVAYTLQVGRASFNHRRVLVAHSVSDAAQALEACDPQRVFTSNTEAQAKSPVFMFTGQGSQYVRMGQGLYESERVFREEVDRCAELLRPHLEADLREILFPAGDRVEEAAEQLDRTCYTQPALFVIEYALAKLLMHWGIKPQAMIGHSIGEYVAATLAETLTLEDALLLVARRGQLMQQQAGGAMLSVMLPEQELRPYLGSDLQLASVNAPQLCVVSGTTEAINEIERKLNYDGHTCRRLHTAHAFHSAMMAAAVSPFVEVAKRVQLKPSRIPFISNVTGAWITMREATDPHYWGKHLRQTVRFASGVSELLKDESNMFVEVGAGQALCTFARQCADTPGTVVASPTLPHPHDTKADLTCLLEALGKLWMSGVRVNWKHFSEDERRCRVPLPTYPFERQRYWIEPRRQRKDAPATKLQKAADVARWLYIPSWKRTRSLASLRTPQRVEAPAGWLLFTDETSLSSRTADKLTQDGHKVVEVRAGKRYERISEQLYVVDPLERQDYERLFRELQAREIVPQHILHLWNAAAAPGASSDSTNSLRDAYYPGFYSLLFIAQSLGRYFPAANIHLRVVAGNVHEIVGGEELLPERAMLLGPCKVIQQESPNISCQCIDVAVPAGDTASLDELVENIIAETIQSSTDNVVAYRGGHRWVQTFEAAPIEPPAEINLLREKGVYLITGGLGRIGLIIAKFLAENYQARLVLVGRTLLPERDAWPLWCSTHDENHPVSRRIEKVRTLESLGSEVMLVGADVADERQMQEVVAQVHQRFGAINGVIHAAGLVNEAARKTIQEITPVECESVFAAKVQGLLTLEKVLRHEQPDFFLLSSSLSTVLGGLGFAAYAAANLFMDGFAHRHYRKGSTKWMSVCWDGWRFSEPNRNQTTADKVNTDLAVTPEEGVEVLKRVLSCGMLPQVAVSTGDLQTRINQWIKLESVRAEANATAPNASPSAHQRPILKNAYAAPANETEEKIAAAWQKVLGISQVGAHDNFFDLGGHSLVAIQLMSRLRETFQVELPLRSIFETPTVAQLALIITQNKSQPQEEHVPAPQVVPRHARTIDQILLELDSAAKTEAQS